MTFDPGDDPLVRMLSSLPVAPPNARHSAHVRARCHQALTGRADGAHTNHAPRSAKLLIALGAAYAAELTRLVVAFYRATS